MKQLTETRTIISILILSFFIFIAGGSAETVENSFYFIVVLFVVGLIIIIIGIIIAHVKKGKRNKQIELYESKISDFDISDKFGDDKCVMYYDKSKHQILVVVVTTSSTNSIIIDSIDKTMAKIQGSGYVIVDSKQKKLLAICQKNGEVSKEIIDYSPKNWNKKYPEIEPCLTGHLNEIILVDSEFGTILTCGFNNEEIKHKVIIYPISKINKTQLKPIISRFIHQSYSDEFTTLIQDSSADILIISESNNSNLPFQRIVKYDSIISVSFEENGNTISSRSTSRTIGGALVGGIILGGAGAVVGGLSGNTSQNKIVSDISVKILLRHPETTSITIKCFHSGQLNTKNESDKSRYESAYKNAQKIKDIITVIIDKIDNEYKKQNVISAQANNNISVADELAKLAKLKESGILTVNEFEQEKHKLLNKS